MSIQPKSKMLICAAAIFMSSAAIATPIGVATVAVEADLAAIENQTALQKWPNIADDLKAAIGDEVFPVTNPDGLDVKVRLVSLSLDGSYQLGDDGRFNTMEGVVVVKRPNEPELAEGMPIKLMATSDTQVVVPVVGADVIVIPASSEDFYNAMISAFASRVGEKVTEFDN